MEKILYCPEKAIKAFEDTEPGLPFGMKVFFGKDEMFKRTVQVKTHKKKRINKKWLKRYGTREEEWVYLINQSALSSLSMTEPKTTLFEKHELDKIEFKVRTDWRIF